MAFAVLSWPTAMPNTESARAAIAAAGNSLMDSSWVREDRRNAVLLSYVDGSGGDGRLVGALLALVVRPGHGDFLARLATGETEMKERILRHRRAPLRRHHGAAVVGDGDVLDEMRRHEIATR